MRIAILHDDSDIFVQFDDVEFVQLLEEKLLQGMTVRDAMDAIIQDLKRKTLTA